MITQKYYLNDYDWAIYILFSVNKSDISEVIKRLNSVDCPKQFIEEGIDNILSNDYNNGFTYSNKFDRISVVVIGETDSPGELLNTLIHEAYHLMKHIFTLDNYTEEDEAQFMGCFIQRISKQLIHFINSL